MCRQAIRANITVYVYITMRVDLEVPLAFVTREKILREFSTGGQRDF